MNFATIITQQTNQNQALSAEVVLLNARCKQYQEAYEYLQEQILEMKRQIFGKRSERFVDPENSQPSLLSDIGADFAAADTEKFADEATQVAAHTRKKTLRRY